MDRELQQKSSLDEDEQYGLIPIALDMPQRERQNLPTQTLPPIDESLDATPVPRHAEFENLIRTSRETEFSELIQHVDNLILDTKGSSMGSGDSMYSTLKPQPLNTSSKSTETLLPTVYVPPSPKKKVRFEVKEDTEEEGWKSDDTIRNTKQDFAATPLPKTRGESHNRSGADLFDRSPPTMPPTPLKNRKDSQAKDEEGNRPDLAKSSLGDSNSIIPTGGTRPGAKTRQRQDGGYYGMAVGYTDEEGRKSGGIFPTKGNERMFEHSSDVEEEAENTPAVGLGIKDACLDESWDMMGTCRHFGCTKRCSKRRVG